MLAGEREGPRVDLAIWGFDGGCSIGVSDDPVGTEVEADGFTMNAKRDARPTSNNDLWDALEKFRDWLYQLSH